MKNYLFILFSIMSLALFSFNTNLENGEMSISWERTSIDFGQLIQGEPASASFTFKNNTEQPVSIASAKASCGCTVANFTEGTIQPGGLGEVTATYNAKKPGLFNKTITVKLNNNDEPMVLTLKGEVKE